MSHTFKVGDRVRHADGCEYVVTELWDFGTKIAVRDYPGFYPADCFVPVDTPAADNYGMRAACQEEPEDAHCWDCGGPMRGMSGTTCNACLTKLAQFLMNKQWAAVQRAALVNRVGETTELCAIGGAAQCVPDDATKELFDWWARTHRKNAMGTKPNMDPVCEPEPDRRAQYIGRAVDNLTRNSAIIGSYRRSDF